MPGEATDYFRIPRPLWRKLRRDIPEAPRRDRGGRPRISDKAVMNGIWYVLWTGCQWKAVHRGWFGVSASVLHERFQIRSNIYVSIKRMTRQMSESSSRLKATPRISSATREMPNRKPSRMGFPKHLSCPALGSRAYSFMAR